MAGWRRAAAISAIGLAASASYAADYREPKVIPAPEIVRPEPHYAPKLMWIGRFTGGRNIAQSFSPSIEKWVDETALFYAYKDCLRWLRDMTKEHPMYDGHKSCFVYEPWYEEVRPTFGTRYDKSPYLGR